MEYVEQIIEGLETMQTEMLQSGISLEKKILFNIQICGLLEAIKQLDVDICNANVDEE